MWWARCAGVLTFACSHWVHACQAEARAGGNAKRHQQCFIAMQCRISLIVHQARLTLLPRPAMLFRPWPRAYRSWPPPPAASPASLAAPAPPAFCSLQEMPQQLLPQCASWRLMHWQGSAWGVLRALRWSDGPGGPPLGSCFSGTILLPWRPGGSRRAAPGRWRGRPLPEHCKACCLLQSIPPHNSPGHQSPFATSPNQSFDSAALLTMGPQPFCCVPRRSTIYLPPVP